ncbi:DUF1534 domain-containing protein [Pseudomonas tremae]|nr:DUF1534 domain-containing protein [Pseudomonas tremae]MCF5743245.1 DUF1534 domain-containing protein [Pseudomonas tremae]
MPCGGRFGEIRWCSSGRLSFLALQREIAFRDVMRHGFTRCYSFRIGRIASRRVCPRGAWARGCFPGRILQRRLIPDAPALPDRLT